MSGLQPSFTDVEYAQRRRVTRRDKLLTMLDEVIPWQEWVGLIRPFYYDKQRGRKPIPIETMLRMYLLQVWFNLSDEGVEDQVNDSYAMRRFMRLDFTVAQVPDATTLLHFRHLIEDHQLGAAMFTRLNELLDAHGWVMRGGTIVDATIIAAPASTKNATGTRDPQMHQTRKGGQRYFGMKAHIGVDAGTGYVHGVAATAANVTDVEQAAGLIRDDDHVVYADAGYRGLDKRPEIRNDAEHLARVEFRVGISKGRLQTMHPLDRRIESRTASIRAKVEHPFLILKRDFGFTKTRYRGLAKNLNLLHIAFASANLLMRARAIALQTR